MVCRAYLKILIFLVLIAFFTERVYPSTLSIVDALGRRVTLEVPIKRAVIAITPELIPALDIWDQVAGVSDWAEKSCSVYQAFVFSGLKKRKPTVGTGTNLNVEAILRLKPDMVITWSYDTRVIEFLESKGIKVIAIWPDTIKELYEVIRLHGKLFGKEKRAEEVIAEMEKMFRFIKERTIKIPSSQRKKILHLGGKPTTVSGKIGITNDIIELIGGINVAGEIKARNVDVSIEKIVKWNPDIIFIWGSAGYDEAWLYNNSQWRFVKAIREKVYKLPHWSTWSPRLAPIALYMAIKTYPELFKDVNFEKITDNFYKKIFGVSYYIVKKYEKY
ncbi:MAG: ABC transporter substrate-binding protein [Thermodesulfobacterium geofontis]|uniref:ABC transporter substrate-binding protein n=1 Tax=Thermodesulfobacterium geofontis TaxID=1295609 RepID=A0A2N7QD25_9BACT|nr:MAG: ABC transporter substrate-binding protein [Thermodesulfobacterium geofontis]